MANRNETLRAHHANVCFIEIDKYRSRDLGDQIDSFLQDEAMGSYNFEQVYGFFEDYYDIEDERIRYMFTHRPTAFAFKMKFY